jgi:hypothetical protein
VARERDESKTERPITLKIVTYRRLDKFKAKLIGDRGASNVTFDEAINVLLDLEEEHRTK